VAFRAQLNAERAALVVERDARRAARTSSQGGVLVPAAPSADDVSLTSCGDTPRFTKGTQKHITSDKDTDRKLGYWEHGARGEVSESLDATTSTTSSSSRKRVRSALRLDLAKKRGTLSLHGIDATISVRESSTKDAKRVSPDRNPQRSKKTKKTKKNKKARKEDSNDKHTMLFEDFASDSASEIDGIFGDLSD